MAIVDSLIVFLFLVTVKCCRTWMRFIVGPIQYINTNYNEIANDDSTISKYINLKSRKWRQLSGGILYSFTSRDETNMFKLYAYRWQLWTLHKISDIKVLENAKRYFTKLFNGMSILSYVECLKSLNTLNQYIAIGIVQYS